MLKKTLKHPKANEEARTCFRETIATYEAQGKTDYLPGRKRFCEQHAAYSRLLAKREALLWAARLAEQRSN